jgi:hypothetical protein
MAYFNHFNVYKYHQFQHYISLILSTRSIYVSYDSYNASVV